MENKGLLIGIGVLVAVAAIGGYLVFSQSKVAPSEIKEITVEGKEYSFSPTSITVAKGEKISLIFKNMGRLSHNLVINGLGVSTKTIPGGTTDVFEFTADKTGTFSFYCSIGNHKSLGMEGKFEVK